MTWSVRKCFKAPAGIRLNVSSSDVRATTGSGPISLNVRPGANYANTTVPGRGTSR
jgi:hypothetical protein